jgi:HNH endonuclease
MPTGVWERPALEKRFYFSVYKTRNCWFWIGAATSLQYGVIKLPHGRTVTAHAASWIIHNGPIPEGIFVLHHCDTRQCVRPDHLFLGTQKDNQQDAAAKGLCGNLAAYLKPLCKNGHVRTAENFYVQPKTGKRQCRICRALADKEIKARRRAESPRTSEKALSPVSSCASRHPA